ncbi:hypothetical protein EVAR_41124_1 [Eumeta japonica]|uniref:Uncharacterized protein n=1 Tax=Eumeta variegata TaxID=151549 RepID=A0A4C1XF21_EUMVA|nr:hypothetical protein EVAR_41124_1 [Eumeta japonica]
MTVKLEALSTELQCQPLRNEVECAGAAALPFCRGALISCTYRGTNYRSTVFFLSFQIKDLSRHILTLAVDGCGLLTTDVVTASGTDVVASSPKHAARGWTPFKLETHWSKSSRKSGTRLSASDLKSRTVFFSVTIYFHVFQSLHIVVQIVTQVIKSAAFKSKGTESESLMDDLTNKFLANFSEPMLIFALLARDKGRESDRIEWVRSRRKKWVRREIWNERVTEEGETKGERNLNHV